MPTYAFRCQECERVTEVMLSMRVYIASPPVLLCCADPMGRYFNTAPGLANVNDRHYDGLRAPDGTDISSRAKHRAYMKQNNLTTVDDFSGTWAKQAKEREERMAGQDATRKADIAEAIARLGG